MPSQPVPSLVTDRDIVCKGLAQDSFDARRVTARDVMTPGIHCCRDDDDLAKAVRHMEQLQVRRLPVINKSSVAAEEAQANRRRHQQRHHQHLPLRHLPAGARGDPRRGDRVRRRP